MGEGILDFLKSPAGQGLLAAGMGYAANARRGAPLNSLGAGGLMGLQAYGGAQQSELDRADKAKTNALRDVQLETNRFTLEDARRKSMNEQGLMGLQGQFLQPGVQAQGGTSAVNSALPPELQIGAQAPIAARGPQFDVKGYTAAAMGKGYMSPLDAFKLQKSMTTNAPIKDLDVKDFTPASVAKFAQTQNYSDLVRMDKLHFADRGGDIQAVDQYTGQPVNTLPKTGNPFSDLLLSDGQGGMRQNSPLIGAKSQVARAGASVNNVSVNTDKSYFGNVAEGLAKNDVALIDAARSAPDRIASAQRVKDILTKNPITGTGAETRLAFNKAFATAGLIDGKTVADTETLASNLASQTLDSIKTSGLGAGQGFTDKDRQFLERAKSGNIEMNSESLRRLADLNEQSARASIKRGNSVIGKLRMSPQAGAMGQQLEAIEEPAAPAKQTPAPPKPMVGMMRNGYRFKGGDPSSPSSWEKK
jgi:hypothetical protein